MIAFSTGPFSVSGRVWWFSLSEPTSRHPDVFQVAFRLVLWPPMLIRLISESSIEVSAVALAKQWAICGGQSRRGARLEDAGRGVRLQRRWNSLA